MTSEGVRMAAKFQIKKASNGEFMFNLKASNGETILTNEWYVSKLPPLQERPFSG
jgi:uncharacterized protein YegP (UPF0339 family)